MHPLSFAARSDDAGPAEVGQVAGDLGLALLEDFDEIANADLSAMHQVEQAKPGGVGQRGEKADEIEGFGLASHQFIIYGLTDICRRDIFALANMK